MQQTKHLLFFQTPSAQLLSNKRCSCRSMVVYTEAKVDVTQEIEQRAQQAAQAGES